MLDLESVRELIEARLNEFSVAASVNPEERVLSMPKLRAFVDGDTFDYWLGRRPRAVSGESEGNEIARVFVEGNLIGPCVSRYVNTVLGKGFDLQWGDGLDADVTESANLWVQSERQKAEIYALMRYVIAFGAAYVYVYWPEAYEEAGNAAQDWPNAFSQIHMQALAADEAGEITDAWGRVVARFRFYAVAKDRLDDKQTKATKDVVKVEVFTPLEVQRYFVDGGKLKLDGAPIPSIYAEENATRVNGWKYQLEKVEVLEAMLNHSVIDHQNKLSEAWTYLQRNTQLAGYPSVIVTNADMSGIVEKNGDVHYSVGPNATLSVVGLPLYSADGPTYIEIVDDKPVKKPYPTNYTDPKVIPVEPADPAHILATVTAHKDAILDRFNQLWTQSASVNVSGESKRESRKAYDHSAISYGGTAANLIKSAVTLALNLASELRGQEPPQALLEVRLYPDVSRGDVTLYAALEAGYKAGYVSLEALMEANPGITDLDIERKRLDEVRLAKLAPLLLDNPSLEAEITALAVRLEALGMSTENALRAAQEAMISRSATPTVPDPEEAGEEPLEEPDGP